jgi:hypothetical protein
MPRWRITLVLGGDWDIKRTMACAAAMAAVAVAPGCSSMVSSATGGLSQSLATAVMNQNDPETVRQGAPAYLLLVDGLIEENPDNPDLLLTAAQLYASFATAFVEDAERAGRLAEKGRDYGWRGLCRSNRMTCGVWSLPYEEFEEAIVAMRRKDVPAVYGSAAAWGTWIRVNRGDWAAVADKARVEAMMLRVVALDEGFQNGGAHLYLGVLATLLPEALGGKPEAGRQHFERAIELSDGRDLMAKVLLARDYARLVFDRELHDRLCREVIESDPDEPGLTLTNTLAVLEAERLLAESEEYFGE